MRVAFALATLLAASGPAGAAEIKALITTGMKSAATELVMRFERLTAHKVSITYLPAGEILQRIQKREPADVIVTGADELARLIKERRMAQITPLTTMGYGVAVKKGITHPDISTPDALKRTLLAAKSVAQPSISRGGNAALYVQRVYARLGITEQLQPKLRFPPRSNGSVAALVANGTAEIGIQQMQELAAEPGVAVVGPLPGKLQDETAIAAGLAAGAREPEAARALIRHLTTPEAKAVYKAKGLGL
jgi:molybdate transport system substrate-binding protein